MTADQDGQDGRPGPATVAELTGPASVRGALRVPGDKSISHRALLFAGLAPGVSVITGLSNGDDVARTRAALAACGVRFDDVANAGAGERSGDRAGDNNSDEVTVHGGLTREPDDLLDMGNSGTGMRLLAGVLAGQDMFTVLTGDRYLRARPMSRVVGPLRQMGASIEGRAGGTLAPLAIRGGRLRAISYPSPVASAQVKSAILLAGLTAAGPTTVIEPTPTRRHTEELLGEFGVAVVVEGHAVTVTPAVLTPAKVAVPGDPSQAAFWAVAGLVAPDSTVRVEDLYLGPGRTGFVGVLRRMGGDIEADPRTGTLQVRTSRLRGIRIGGAEVPDIIDEIPALAIAAAAAEGTTVISDAAELRVKESDRITSTVRMLTAFGCAAQETPDGMIIEGGARLHGAQVDSFGDHRIAMSAAVGSLLASGTTTIEGWDCVATSYPGFLADLHRLSSNGS